MTPFDPLKRDDVARVIREFAPPEPSEECLFEFAAEGFIAVAPDLLSGMGPDGGGTASLGARHNVVATIRT